jgi:Domain of unknown function (DUF4336)
MDQLAPDLWVVTRPLRLVVGDVGCRMTVLRLADGGLWVHSPVEIDAETVREIDAVGPVRWIVAPNRVHHLFVRSAAARYPAARLFAAPGLPEKKRDLSFHEVLGDDAPPDWRGQIDQHVVRGMPVMNEVAFCHRASRTLVLTDLAFNVARDRTAGARLFYWLVGAAGWFGPHRIVRFGIRDRAAARRSMDAILAWEFDRVIVSHGDVLERGGRERLAEGYSFLT